MHPASIRALGVSVCTDHAALTHLPSDFAIAARVRDFPAAFPASSAGCPQRDRADHHQGKHDDGRVLRALVDDVPDHQAERCDRGEPVDGLTPPRQGAKALQPAHAAVAFAQQLTTASRPRSAKMEGAWQPTLRPYLIDLAAMTKRGPQSRSAWRRRPARRRDRASESRATAPSPGSPRRRKLRSLRAPARRQIRPRRLGSALCPRS
jgi:hypothetical protein